VSIQAICRSARTRGLRRLAMIYPVFLLRLCHSARTRELRLCRSAPASRRFRTVIPPARAGCAPARRKRWCESDLAVECREPIQQVRTDNRYRSAQLRNPKLPKNLRAPRTMRGMPARFRSAQAGEIVGLQESPDAAACAAPVPNRAEAPPRRFRLDSSRRLADGPVAGPPGGPVRALPTITYHVCNQSHKPG
jgi:hypothetical protein